MISAIFQQLKPFLLELQSLNLCSFIDSFMVFPKKASNSFLYIKSTLSENTGTKLILFDSKIYIIKNHIIHPHVYFIPDIIFIHSNVF